MNLLDIVSIPSLKMVSKPQEVRKSRNAKTRRTSKLENKIVVNVGFLMEPSDTPNDVLRKLAGCVADAGGLGIDFRGL